jgi:hypothetical protein
MPVREISNDSLNGELTSAGDKLVMVDFFATWFELFSFIIQLLILFLGAAHVKISRHILKL